MAGYEMKRGKHGRSLYATWQFYKGESVLENDIIIVPIDSVPDYVFKFNKTKDCICLGDGSLFNHSDNPNVKYKLTRTKYMNGTFGEWRMEFWTKRMIRDGEELTIDYRQDSPGLDLSRYGIKE